MKFQPMEFLKKLKPREQLIALITAVVASLCILFQLAIVPAFDKLGTIQREILVRKKQWVAYQRAVNQKDQILRVANRYSELLPVAGSDEEETSNLLKEIEGMARQAGVKVVNLKPRPVEKQGPSKWFMVTIEAESSLEQLTRFLYQIEQSPRLLRIERLDVKQPDQLQEPLKATLQISRMVIP